VTLRGSTSDFPLESVIGLLAGTSKTGELQVRSGAKVGGLGFSSGRLIAAVMDGEGGENALGAIFAISEADFEFTPWESAPDANLEPGDLVSVLKRAAEARDRITAIRSSIPDDGMRFRLSEKAADQGAVTFTPDRWRALLAVNGDRDVVAIAEQLRLGKMQALTLLAGLVREGVIDVLPAADARSAEAHSSTAVSEPSAPPEPGPTPPAPEPAPHAKDWSAPERHGQGTESEWSSGGPAPAQERTTNAPVWTARTPEVPAAEESAAPPLEVRDDPKPDVSPRMGGFGPVPESSAPGVEVPPAVDDRLASLSGLFAPGPAASVPPQASAPGRHEGQPTESWRVPAESWTTPPPASSETPANTWAPLAKARETLADADPWNAPASTSADEWAPPPPQPTPSETAAEKKKLGGFLSRFRREETPAPIVPAAPGSPAASNTGKLASLSNALLMEYNSGGYGKGKIETRLGNLLMRVDEQADPIDRPLPVVDDLIDAAALEREGFDEHQAVPYLATLVRQIYEDAERAFGKDKAKKGYKAAQQQVFGGDPNALQSPELAGLLPKV
jgi:hypothetical protein